jgi:hypothetical protein
MKIQNFLSKTFQKHEAKDEVGDLNKVLVNDFLCEIQNIKVLKQKEIKHFEQKIFIINHEMEKFMSDHKKLITFYEKGENKTK